MADYAMIQTWDFERKTRRKQTKFCDPEVM
jgi:hypothetical protein